MSGLRRALFVYVADYHPLVWCIGFRSFGAISLYCLFRIVPVCFASIVIVVGASVSLYVALFREPSISIC